MDDLDLGATVRGLTPGQNVFKRYTLKKILGQGGMGIVWLATDESLGRDVAIKMLPELVARDPVAIKDLKRETARSQQLSHPHILRIYDFAEDEAHRGITMECVLGGSLAALRLNQPSEAFTVAQISPWVRQLCEALTYAHEVEHIVHRDLKPANLMLTEDGRLKVADFGIAASVSDSVSRVSAHVRTSGTPTHMSPQQMMGEKPSVTDDLYALGATLYELLTSRPPFYTGNVIAQVQGKIPPTLAERRAKLGITLDETIPATWSDTIAACLAKDAAARPQSAREVATRLGLIDTSAPALAAATTSPPPAITAVAPPSPTVPTATEPEAKKKPRRLGLILGLGAVGVALIAAFPFLAEYRAPTPPATASVVAPPPSPQKTPPTTLATPVATTGTLQLPILPDETFLQIDGAPATPDPLGRIEIPPGEHVVSISRMRYAPVGARFTVAAGQTFTFTPNWIGDWDANPLFAEYWRLIRGYRDRDESRDFDVYMVLLLEGLRPAVRNGMTAESVSNILHRTLEEAWATADPADQPNNLLAVATALYLVDESAAAEALRAVVAAYSPDSADARRAFLNHFDPTATTWLGQRFGSPWVVVSDLLRTELPRYEEGALAARDAKQLIRLYQGYLGSGLVKEGVRWRERCEAAFPGNKALTEGFRTASDDAAIRAEAREWFRAYFRQDLDALDQLGRANHSATRSPLLRDQIAQIYFDLGLDQTLDTWVRQRGELPFAYTVRQGLWATGDLPRLASYAQTGPRSALNQRLLARVGLAQFAQGFPDATRTARARLDDLTDSLALADRALLDALLGDQASATQTLDSLESTGVLSGSSSWSFFDVMTAAAEALDDQPRLSHYQSITSFPEFRHAVETLVLLDRIDETLAWSELGNEFTGRVVWTNKLDWLLLKPHRLATLPWVDDTMSERVMLELLWRRSLHPPRASLLVAVPNS